MSWLSAQEAEIWRSWIDVSWRIERTVGDQLRSAASLSHREYAILSQLSGRAERTARMSEIARLTQNPKTRLTHQVSRLEEAGYVTRHPAPHDARVTLVRLTDEGLVLLERIASGHAAEVRRVLFDGLSPRLQRNLAEVLTALSDHLDE